MSYKGFYKYIIKVGDHYQIMKGNEKFGTYNRLADALYERDRLIAVDWDWDKYVVDYVRNIVDSSVTKDKDKLLDILYKCGLDYTEAKKALNTVYGREEFN